MAVGGNKGGNGRKKGKKTPAGKDLRNVTDGRQARVRVKTAKRRTTSSARWLERQLNDPYVAEARRLGYRSRAAFKLIQIDEKYDLIGPDSRIVDLGCAPGGWTQVALEIAGNRAQVVGMDLLEVEPIAGATLLQGDFNDDEAPDRLIALMGGPADLVMSDMAAVTTGHGNTDHLRIIALVELALDFARNTLRPEGAFVAKVFSGGAENSLMAMLKRDFKRVAHFKPPASRKDSAEMYVVAMGYRGDNLADDTFQNEGENTSDTDAN